MHVGCACLSLARSGADRALKQWSTIELPKYASHFWLGTHINREIEPCAIDEGKAASPWADPRRGTLEGIPLPPLCLPHSFTRSLCLSHTNEELMMWTIIVKINSIRGYSRLKKLPVMTCWISESKTETEVKAESERGFCCGKRGSLVRHRLCLCVWVCLYFVLSWVWGTSEGCRQWLHLCPFALPCLCPCPYSCPSHRPVPLCD